MLWNDRQGRFSPLKAATLAAVILPGLWLAFRLANGMLGAKPVTEALHETGLWSLRLLLITLAITPLRLVTGWNRLVLVRRMLGVAALAYLLIHFMLYFVDQKFVLLRIASEIALRFYLTIGFVGLIAMLALGITSTDGMIRRLGAANWNRLHSLVYPLALVALWHGALQSKIDASEHIIMAGIFVALMLVRGMKRRISFTPLPLLGVAALATIATAGIEYGWYRLATALPADRVFAANFMADLQPRPALLAGLIALALPVTALLAKWLPVSRNARYTPA